MKDSHAARAPLRVGLMVHAFPAISETFVSTLAADIALAGHEVRILATDPEAPAGPVHDIVARAGLGACVARPAPRGRLPVARMLALARAAPSRAPRLAALALLDRLAPARLGVTRMLSAEAPFDLVHAQFGPAGLTALRHRRWGTLRTRALVVHFRGYDITRFVEERGRDVYAGLFAGADLFIANCAHFRDRAIALGCPPEKIVVIGSPIDTASFAPPSAAPPTVPPTVPPSGRPPHDGPVHGGPVHGGPVRLVAVGRLVEKKGFADAVAAVARLTREGREVRLDILGEGELRPALEAQIAAAGLGGRVVLHGAATHAQVIAALHAADIALAPSVTAANGDQDAAVNTAKEAMATGLPVIGTRHGGIPELVIPGENGDLVPERDPAALAGAIARMMDNPGRWPALGTAGRRKVVAEYDRAAIIARTLDAYELALIRAGERV